MKLKGTISISNSQGSRRGGYISLRITDELSHDRIVEVELDYEEWGKAIAGIAEQPCALDYNSNGPFGLRREHKTELVPYRLKDGFLPSKEDAEKVIASFETDGWKGFPDDYLNSNNDTRCSDGMRYRRVGFVRYVEPTKESE